MICAIALAGFFWVGNYENLTWEIQLAVVLSVLFVLGSCWVATAPQAASLRLDLLFAAAAAILAVAASYCTLFGLAAIPAVLCQAVYARWRIAKSAVFLVVVTMLILPVFSRQGGSSIATKIPDPLPFLAYIGRLLSIPFKAAGESIIGLSVPDAIYIAIAWTAVAMVAILGLLRLRRVAPDNRHFDFALLLVITSLAMAAEIALGRTGMNFGTDSRYSVVALFFWFGALGVFLLSAKATPSRLTLGAALSTMLLLAFAVSTPRIEQAVRARTQTIFGAGVAASLGVYDLDPYRIFIAPLPVEVKWPRPRGEYQTYRDGPPFGWAGKPVSSFRPRPADHRCFGHVDIKTVLNAEKQLLNAVGWAFAHKDSPRIAAVFLVDAAGNIVGLARPGLNRPDIYQFAATHDFGPRSATLYSGFSAVVKADPQAEIALWALDARGRVCRVEGAR